MRLDGQLRDLLIRHIHDAVVDVLTGKQTPLTENLEKDGGIDVNPSRPFVPTFSSLSGSLRRDLEFRGRWLRDEVGDHSDNRIDAGPDHLQCHDLGTRGQADACCQTATSRPESVRSPSESAFRRLFGSRFLGAPPSPCPQRTHTEFARVPIELHAGHDLREEPLPAPTALGPRAQDAATLPSRGPTCDHS